MRIQVEAFDGRLTFETSTTFDAQLAANGVNVEAQQAAVARLVAPMLHETCLMLVLIAGASNRPAGVVTTLSVLEQQLVGHLGTLRHRLKS